MACLLVKDFETEMKWHVETSKRCSYLTINLGQTVGFDKGVRGCLNQEVHMI